MPDELFMTHIDIMYDHWSHEKEGNIRAQIEVTNQFLERR
jgi:hypothetical protein